MENNYNQYVIQFGKISGLALLLFFLAASNLNAQDSLTSKQNNSFKVTISDNKKVDLEFTPQNKSSNLLVILIDNFGNTVFLDSQHNFAGSYKHTIDLSKNEKSDYLLKIVCDNEIVNKKLSFP